MSLGAIAAGSSAMAFCAWRSHTVDKQFDLGLKLSDPLAGIAAFITVVILAFAQLHGSVPIFLGVAAVCAVTDIRSGYIFDAVTLPAFGVLVFCGFVQHASVETLEGGVACAAALLLPYVLSRGRGIGLGDVKLALCVGAAFGLRSGLLVLSVAFILGGCVGAMLLMSGKGRRNTEIRFAPFLAFGSALIAVLNP